MSNTTSHSPASLYLGNLHVGASRNSTKYALARAVRFFSKDIPPEQRMKVEEFAWHSLRYPEIVALRAYLAENAAPASGNRVLCAIKQVLYEARKLKMIDPDDYVSIKEVKRIPGYREPCGRALAGCEISSMFDAARSTGSRWQRKRNAAMLAIMFGGGLRRTEIVRLTLERVVEVGGGFELKVLGKGNKERIVPLPTMLTPVVRQWLNERGSAGTWLFPKGRDELTRAMSGDNLCKQLQMLATRAKIESLTPHDARRTFITTLLDIGVDIVIVAGLAGHAKLETTRAYDRRDRRAQKRAVEHLSFQLPESVPHSLEVQPETPTTPNTFPMHLFVSKPLTLVH